MCKRSIQLFSPVFLLFFLPCMFKASEQTKAAKFLCHANSNIHSDQIRPNKFGETNLTNVWAEARVSSMDYYVSPSGDDNNSGKSPDQPWQTINKVNNMTFGPGDRIFFEGGKTFSNGLKFDADDGGTPANPITIGSYGTGSAIISSGTNHGLDAHNCAGFNIKDLIFVGSGANNSAQIHGIYFHHDQVGKLEHIYIDNVKVRDYRLTGIAIGKYGSSGGFKDVRITNAEVYDNGDLGIGAAGKWKLLTHENIYIGHCKVYNNRGIKGKGSHSGSGVILAQVDGGIIEYCEAYNNGENCDYTGGGPVGLWTWDSNNILIQFNESHHNNSVYKDGGGFDIDGGCTKCYLQYNYSHDNKGPGFMICQFSGSDSLVHNYCRYNISQNDGSGFYLCSGDTKMDDSYIYNNTFYNDNQATVGILTWSGGEVGKAFFHNNIFICGKNHIIGGSQRAQFQGNAYWDIDGSGFSVDGYNSFEDWIAGTGQEKIGDKVVGRFVNPLFSNPGGGTTIGNPDQLATLTAYQLQPESPMIDAGLDLRAMFGIDPGRRDFYGNLLPQLAGFDIGAHESATGSSVKQSNDITPHQIELGNNYPNPFNAMTIIPYKLSLPGLIKIAIYNSMGQTVALLVTGFHPAGNFSVIWDGTNHSGHPVTGGIYFCKLSTDCEVASIKMTITR